MKMKLFGRANEKKDGSGVAQLEADVNEWLERNPGVEIVHIKQSASGGSLHASKLFITVWYNASA